MTRQTLATFSFPNTDERLGMRTAADFVRWLGTTDHSDGAITTAAIPSNAKGSSDIAVEVLSHLDLAALLAFVTAWSRRTTKQVVRVEVGDNKIEMPPGTEHREIQRLVELLSAVPTKGDDEP